MELNDLIPDKSTNWTVGKFLMYKKYVNIPICYIDDNIVYIFLDGKIHKAIFKLVKHLIEMGVEFYFTTPRLSSPKFDDDLNETVIKHYLFSHSQLNFFDGFRNIGFDLINNMVKWSDKEDCYNLIKPNFDLVAKSVESISYDYFNNSTIYNYPEEIREEFRTLYRDIQLNKIL